MGALAAAAARGRSGGSDHPSMADGRLGSSSLTAPSCWIDRAPVASMNLEWPRGAWSAPLSGARRRGATPGALVQFDGPAHSCLAPMGSSGHCLLRATRPGSIPPFAPTCCRGPSALGLGRFANSVRQTGLSLRPGTARLAPTCGLGCRRPTATSTRFWSASSYFVLWSFSGLVVVTSRPMPSTSLLESSSERPYSADRAGVELCVRAEFSSGGLLLVPMGYRLGRDTAIAGPLALSGSVCGDVRDRWWSLRGLDLDSRHHLGCELGPSVVLIGSRSGLGWRL